MNDLGLTLAWLAVQVALVLVPALALHALASRRGPASGAWIATLSLGLVAALSVAAFLPVDGRDDRSPDERIAPSPPARAKGATAATAPGSTGRVIGSDRARSVAGHGWTLAGLRLAWTRLERGAAEPAAQFRPWGSTLAAFALAGTGIGLLRLVIGLSAVGLCRRRGRTVDDPGMNGLLDELRASMGCRLLVELREVPDLTTPATAGWRRPLLLVPEDWRSWDASERRAVFAHELAHIIRGDYAAGLLARLAVVLNPYHPMVRWMVGRLQLQQELAADALGARYAGGRASYLAALSSLALRQDGRSPCWPARAFLPAQGTLIRRIAMLRDETGTGTFDRRWSGAQRLLMAVGLLGMTIGVATLRGPARGAESDPPAAAGVKAPAPRAGEMSFVPLYVPENMDGLVMLRPAATSRRIGMGRLVPLIREVLGVDLSDLSKDLKVDTSRPGHLKLGCEDIEWVTGGISFGRGKDVEKDNLHRLIIGSPTVRTVAPFDWLAFLGQWRFEFEEVRDGGHAYYKVKGPTAELLGPDPCVYLPDDRTLILDGEKAIRKLAGRDSPATPDYLRGPDWERASRGLLAVAINNQDGAFAKRYDLGRPDDAVVLSLFKGVDYWVLGVEDADAIVLHAAAACDSRDATEPIGRAIDSLLKLARDVVEHPDPEALAAGDRILRMAKALLANVRVERTDRSVNVRAEGFGTLVDLASIVGAQAGRAKSQELGGGDGPEDSKR